MTSFHIQAFTTTSWSFSTTSRTTKLGPRRHSSSGIGIFFIDAGHQSQLCFFLRIFFNEDGSVRPKRKAPPPSPTPDNDIMALKRARANRAQQRQRDESERPDVETEEGEEIVHGHVSDVVA